MTEPKPLKYQLDQKMVTQIEKSFVYHSPKEDQPERYVQLRSQTRELAYSIAQLCPPSREQSLAITNLEQAIMWANKSIACNE